MIYYVGGLEPAGKINNLFSKSKVFSNLRLYNELHRFTVKMSLANTLF